MERSRQISPSTRQITSTSYKVDIRDIRADEKLTITITHAEIPSFKEIYEFDGKFLQEKNSIHFKWEEGKVIWQRNVRPTSITKSRKQSINPCSHFKYAIRNLLKKISRNESRIERKG